MDHEDNEFLSNQDETQENSEPEVIEGGPKVYDGPYSTEANEQDVKVELYDAAKGKSPRTGGPYLDEVEAEEAEKRRAKVENREPDLDNPPATVGTVLVPKHHLRETDTDKSHYSDAISVTNEPVDSYVVPAVHTEPDPSQVSWDHDQQKVDALKAEQEYANLTGKSE
jgi:hypothetical protein